MNIDHIKLPPVSQKFYDRLIQTFPPLNPLDIKKSTDMIDIHRNAAQQEVLEYIKQSVRSEDSEGNIKLTFWDRFKYVFKL